MAERFPSARQHGPKQPDNQAHPPPFPRKQRLPSDRPGAVPGREAAKRTLDGADRYRSGIVRDEGKEGNKPGSKGAAMPSNI